MTWTGCPTAIATLVHVFALLPVLEWDELHTIIADLLHTEFELSKSWKKEARPNAYDDVGLPAQQLVMFDRGRHRFNGGQNDLTQTFLIDGFV